MWFRVAVVVLAALIAGAQARADEPPDPVLVEAKELYDEGLRLYEEGRHAEAAVRFRRAYELSRAPGLLWNLAQAERLAGDCADAMHSYRDYLRADPAAENAADARAHLAEMKRCADERAALDPKPDPDAGGDVEPIDDGNVEGAQLVPPAPRPASPVDRGRTRRLAGYVLAGVGVGLVGTGVVFGLSAADHAAELEERYAVPGAWDDEAAAIEEAGERDETLAVVFLSVGAAAVVAGATLVILGLPDDEPAVGVSPVAGGAAITWGGRF